MGGGGGGGGGGGLGLQGGGVSKFQEREIPAKEVTFKTHVNLPFTKCQFLQSPPWVWHTNWASMSVSKPRTSRSRAWLTLSEC